MITEVSDINLRQNLGALLNQVEDRKDSILISKDGKPVAALVDAELFARINRIRDRFDDLANRIAEDYAQTPVEIGLAEIDAAVAAQRAQ
jgi:prevent-host-death family protein